MNCWLQKEYIGIGTAAHSYMQNVRYSNCNNIEKYIKNMEEEENKNIYEIEEIQELEDRKKEYMLLGLRKIDGVQISKFKEKYIDNPLFIYRKELNLLVEEGLINIDGDFIKLTNKGIDFANLVWEEFV